MTPLGDDSHGPITGNITLHGFTALRTKLANLADEGTRRQIGNETVLAGGSVLVGPMRRAAPKRKRRLARSIMVILDHQHRRPGVCIALAGPTRPGGEAAPVIEFGSDDRYTKNPRRYVGRMPARPFVGPTGLTYAPQAQHAMAETLAAGVEREFE